MTIGQLALFFQVANAKVTQVMQDKMDEAFVERMARVADNADTQDSSWYQQVKDGRPLKCMIIEWTKLATQDENIQGETKRKAIKYAKRAAIKRFRQLRQLVQHIPKEAALIQSGKFPNPTTDLHTEVPVVSKKGFFSNLKNPMKGKLPTLKSKKAVGMTAKMEYRVWDLCFNNDLPPHWIQNLSFLTTPLNDETMTETANAALKTSQKYGGKVLNGVTKKFKSYFKREDPNSNQ